MVARIDLFISHSSRDAERAREIRGLLESAGYTCWMAPDDVTSHAPWAEQILEAIDAARAIVVLVSEGSNRSPHVAREVDLASGRRRVVVPIRVEPVTPAGSLEYHLAGLQRIDVFPAPIGAHREGIVRRMTQLVAPSRTPVPASASPIAVAADSEAHVVPAIKGPSSQNPTQSRDGAGFQGPVRTSRTSVRAGSNVVIPPSSSRGMRWLTFASSGAAIAVVVAVSLGAAGLTYLGGFGFMGRPSPTPVPSNAVPASQRAPASPSQAASDSFPNASEIELLSLVPNIVDRRRCSRHEDRYERSIAMISCPTDRGTSAIFVALYPQASAMTVDYDGIMEAAGVAKTASGCFELGPDPANTEWMLTAGEAGIPEGYLGCFPRNDGGSNGVQFVWTRDSQRVLVAWLAPDYPLGLDLFDAWVAAPSPAQLRDIQSGASIEGTSTTFHWTAAVGSPRFISLYVGSTPPPQPCHAWFCEEPNDDALASSDVTCACGLPPTQLSATVRGLPADGSSIYVRLFTKFEPEDGLLTWRDYLFTSTP